MEEEKRQLIDSSPPPTYKSQLFDQDGRAPSESSPAVNSCDSHPRARHEAAAEQTKPAALQLLVHLKQLCNLFLGIRRRKLLSVEPVMFAYMLGLFLYSSVSGQYVLNRYGRDKLQQLGDDDGGPWDFCINTTYLDERTQSRAAGVAVESSASHLGLINSLASQLPAFVPALLYGPTSDRVGRKPMLLLIATAGCLSGTVYIVVITLDLNLYFLTLVAFLIAVGGSVPGIITITYSYIADVSSKKLLTLRIGILEAMLFLGIAVGILISGQWLNDTGCDFIQPMWFYLGCNLFIIFYVVLYLPESLSMAERQALVQNGTGGVRILARGVKILFVGVYSRWRIWFSLVMVAVLYLLASGVTYISTLYLYEHPLVWNAGQIAIFQSVSQLCSGLSLIVVLPILVAVRLPDTLIVILADLLAIAVFILNGFVRNTWEMYVGMRHTLKSVTILVGCVTRYYTTHDVACVM